VSEKREFSKQTKKERLLKAALDVFGFQAEELEQELDKQTGVTVEDLLHEAESLHQLFRVRGQGFKFAECRQCGGTFAYSHQVDNIKFCTIECASIFTRESYGIRWTPNKPAHERWGRYRPVVIPSHALEAMRDIVGSLEDHENGTSL
jgi:hypothetical protein